MGVLEQLKHRIQGKIPSGSKRSSQWGEVRAMHLQHFPKCAMCGGTKKLEVHHIVPFHQAPELELDLTNLITLCESKKGGVTCHQFFGHLGNYKNANPSVREDVQAWAEKIQKSKVG